MLTVAFSSRIGQQVVALPHPRTPPGGNLDALETEFLLNPHRAVTGMYQSGTLGWGVVPWRRAGGRLALQRRRSESCVCLRTAASNSPSACRRGSEVGSKQQLTAHVVQVWLAHARGNKINSAAIKGLAAIRSFQSASLLHGQQFVRPRERRRPQRIKGIR